MSLLPSSRSGDVRHASSPNDSSASSGNIARFLSDTVSRATRGPTPHTSPIPAGKTRPVPDLSPEHDGSIWQTHRSRFVADHQSDLSRSNSLSGSGFSPLQAGSSRSSAGSIPTTGFAQTSNSFSDYSLSFNAGSPTSATSTGGSGGKATASEKARRRKSSFPSPKAHLSISPDGQAGGVSVPKVKLKERKQLQKGGGEGMDWFRRDNIHSQWFQPHSTANAASVNGPPANAPYILPYLRTQADLEYVRNEVLKTPLPYLPWTDKKPLADLKPKRVLDIGCGPTLSWIVDAAEVWPDAHFTGLDLCPLLLPLDRLPASTSSRITYDQRDFLSPPSPSLPPGPFDFVRVSHIGTAVPEEKWQALFDALAMVVTKEGWIQVIDSNLPSALDTESKQWADAKPATAGAVQESGVASKAEEHARVHTSRTEAVGAAIAATFAKRKVSLFPTSIFPASFVLSTKNVQTDGPITLVCPAGPPKLASDEYWSSAEGQAEMGMRIWQHAEFDALTAESFYDGLTPSEGSERPSVKETEELETCVRELRATARVRSGLASLLTQRFSWSCSADVEVASALAEQITALDAERDLLRSEAAAARARGEELDQGDEWRLQDVERSLRETKAELEAAKIRNGDLSAWKDPMSERGFEVQVLMKAGRSAL